MGDGMGQRLLEEVFLQVENVLPHGLDFTVLGFGLTPHEEVDLALVVRETGRDFLAEDHAGPMGDLETAGDGVVIRESDVVHARGTKAFIDLLGIGVAGGKIQTTQNPVSRTGAVAGVDVKIGSGHGGQRVRERANQSS